MNDKILMARERFDRMVLLKMESDPYAAQMIPVLQHQVIDLTRALKALVAASGDASLANREEALAAARRVLARSGPPGQEAV